MGLFGFSSNKQRAAASEPSTGGRLVYAIGDVHGRLDLLEDLLEQIMVDLNATKPAEAAALVLLGDYVDRGACSREVIDCLIRLKDRPDIELRALKGNHEEALLGFLADPQSGPPWLQNGGAATLASYGVAAPQTRLPPEIWQTASEAFAEALPPEHLSFLQNLELYVEYGDYVFVHAGLRPGVPIDHQTERDLLWIRKEFLEETRRFAKVVVHGHTPEPEPFMGDVRLGVDTGAYATGVLSAARLYGTERSILQATAHGDQSPSPAEPPSSAPILLPSARGKKSAYSEAAAAFRANYGRD
jgi:serine/threonine protein phosphatase 1